MERKKYVYWQNDGIWLGYLEEYPDYMTQGETLEDLKENLRDIYKELKTQDWIEILCGKYRDVLTPTEDYIREKQDEIDIEERKFTEHNN